MFQKRKKLKFYIIIKNKVENFDFFLRCLGHYPDMFSIATIIVLFSAAITITLILQPHPY